MVLDTDKHDAFYRATGQYNAAAVGVSSACFSIRVALYCYQPDSCNASIYSHPHRLGVVYSQTLHHQCTMPLYNFPYLFCRPCSWGGAQSIMTY